MRGVTNLKLGQNIEDAYGGVPSEYGIESDDSLFE